MYWKWFMDVVNLIKTVIKHCVTEKDGESYDLARILWAIGTLVFFGCTVYSLHKGQTFDYTSWGVGFGSVLAAGSIGIKVKETTEQPIRHDHDDHDGDK